MKKTTYIMLGLVIAGFIAVAALCAVTITWESPYVELNLGGGTEVRKELPRFSQLEFSVRGEIYYYNVQGATLNLKECDSVAAPFVETWGDTSSALTLAMKGDTLYLTVDYNKLKAPKDTTLRGERRVRYAYVSSSGAPLATVVVPRGMMRGARTIWGPLCLDGFDAPFFKAESDEGIILTDCRLDTLRSASATLNNLELIDSQVGYAGIRQPKNNLKVVTEGEVCGITRMEVSGDRRKNGSGLNLYRANVGEVNWVPTDSNARLNVLLGKPAEIRIR